MKSFNEGIVKTYESDTERFASLCKLAESFSDGDMKWTAFRELYKEIFGNDLE